MLTKPDVIRQIKDENVTTYPKVRKMLCWHHFFVIYLQLTWL